MEQAGLISMKASQIIRINSVDTQAVSVHAKHVQKTVCVIDAGKYPDQAMRGVAAHVRRGALFRVAFC